MHSVVKEKATFPTARILLFLFYFIDKTFNKIFSLLCICFHFAENPFRKYKYHFNAKKIIKFNIQMQTKLFSLLKIIEQYFFLQIILALYAEASNINSIKSRIETEAFFIYFFVDYSEYTSTKYIDFSLDWVYIKKYICMQYIHIYNFYLISIFSLGL